MQQLNMIQNNQELTKTQQVLEVPKQEVAKIVRNQIFSKKSSLRKLATQINTTHRHSPYQPNIHANTIIRITNCENYTIDNLLLVLDALGLELTVQPKQEETPQQESLQQGPLQQVTTEPEQINNDRVLVGS